MTFLYIPWIGTGSVSLVWPKEIREIFHFRQPDLTFLWLHFSLGTWVFVLLKMLVREQKVLLILFRPRCSLQMLYIWSHWASLFLLHDTGFHSCGQKCTSVRSPKMLKWGQEKCLKVDAFVVKRKFQVLQQKASVLGVGGEIVFQSACLAQDMLRVFKMLMEVHIIFESYFYELKMSLLILFTVLIFFEREGEEREREKKHFIHQFIPQMHTVTTIPGRSQQPRT